MNVSREEALSIFRKWEEEKSLLRLLLKGINTGGIFTGRVFQLTPSEVTMIPASDETVNPDSSFITVSFLSADSFTFIDPRDAGEDRDLVSAEMTYGLFVSFSTGERCTWVEVP